MSDLDESSIRELMHGAMADVHIAPGVASTVVTWRRRRQRRAAVARVAVTGVAAGTTVGVVAAVSATGNGARPAGRRTASMAEAPRPTAAQRALYHLSDVAMVTTEPSGRYVTMIDHQSDSAANDTDVQRSVWDSLTGDIWTYQAGGQGPSSFPVQRHGSPTTAEFAAMPTDPASLRSRLLAEYNYQESQGRAALALQLQRSGQLTSAQIQRLSQSPADEWSDDAKVFSQANQWLYNPLVGSSLRAALFRLLAATPGVEVDSDATDSRGRAAVKISLTYVDDGETMVQTTYQDPATGGVLEQSETQRNDASGASDTDRDVYVSVSSSDTAQVH